MNIFDFVPMVNAILTGRGSAEIAASRLAC